MGEYYEYCVLCEECIPSYYISELAFKHGNCFVCHDCIEDLTGVYITSSYSRTHDKRKNLCMECNPHTEEFTRYIEKYDWVEYNFINNESCGLHYLFEEKEEAKDLEEILFQKLSIPRWT